MTTLHMKTDEVRNAARKIDLAVGDLYFKPGALKSAGSSLRSAWQGGKSSYYASQLQQMGNALHEEVINLQRLAKKLNSEVDQWEDADRNSNFDGLAIVKNIPLGAGVSFWGLSEKLRKNIDDLKDLRALGATIGVISGMVPGVSYAGQVIFNGGQRMKHLAGVSSHLTHIQAMNLPSHMLAQAGGLNKISKFDIGMGVWEGVNKGARDWARYDKTSDKLASVGIDAIFVGAKTAVKYYASNYGGYLVATAAVTALTAVGAPVVGVAAAGMLAWWGGSIVTGKLSDFVFDRGYDWLEKSGRKDAAVHALGSTLESTADGIKNTARAADNAFRNVISNVFG